MGLDTASDKAWNNKRNRGGRHTSNDTFVGSSPPSLSPMVPTTKPKDVKRHSLRLAIRVDDNSGIAMRRDVPVKAKATKRPKKVVAPKRNKKRTNFADSPSDKLLTAQTPKSPPNKNGWPTETSSASTSSGLTLKRKPPSSGSHANGTPSLSGPCHKGTAPSSCSEETFPSPPSSPLSGPKRTAPSSPPHVKDSPSTSPLRVSSLVFSGFSLSPKKSWITSSLEQKGLGDVDVKMEPYGEDNSHGESVTASVPDLSLMVLATPMTLSAPWRNAPMGSQAKGSPPSSPAGSRTPDSSPEFLLSDSSLSSRICILCRGPSQSFSGISGGAPSPKKSRITRQEDKSHGEFVAPVPGCSSWSLNEQAEEPVSEEQVRSPSTKPGTRYLEAKTMEYVDAEPIKCSICHFSTLYLLSLKRHFKLRHSVDWSSVASKYATAKQRPASICLFCNKKVYHGTRHQATCKQAKLLKSQVKRGPATRKLSTTKLSTTKEVLAEFRSWCDDKYGKITARNYYNSGRKFLLHVQDTVQGFSIVSLFGNSHASPPVLIPPSNVDDYLGALSSGYCVIHAKKSIAAVMAFFSYVKDRNPLLLGFDAVINIAAVKKVLKSAGRRGVKDAMLLRNKHILRAEKQGSLMMRPFDVALLLSRFRRSPPLAKVVEQLTQQGPKEVSITLLRDWAILFLFLEGNGQRGKAILDLKAVDFKDRAKGRDGSWIISISSHKTNLKGTAKVIVNDELAKSVLQEYGRREGELKRKCDLFFRTDSGQGLQFMRSSFDILRDHMLRMDITDPLDLGLDTLTSGSVRKSFATLAQVVPGLKDRLPWVMSHSSVMAEKYVDDNHCALIQTKKMVGDVLRRIASDASYLKSLKTNSKGLNYMDVEEEPGTTGQLSSH